MPFLYLPWSSASASISSLSIHSSLFCKAGRQLLLFFKCTIQGFLVYSESCVNTTLILEHSHCYKINPVPTGITPQFSPLPRLLRVFTEFNILDISDQRNGKTRSLYYLASFTWHDEHSLFIVRPRLVPHSFFQPNHILFYGQTRFYIFIHNLMGIWMIYNFWLLQIML